jgi:hypothetical protein
MRKWVGAALGCAAVAGVIVAIAAGGASASNGGHAFRWGGGAMRALHSSSPRAKHVHRLVLHTRSERFKFIDNDGNNRDSVGDVFLFTESLWNGRGHRVGTTIATCTEQFLNSSECAATLRLFGRGQITVAGAVGGSQPLLAVTGGTGGFSDAGGQMDTARDNVGERGVLVVWLRHLA